MRRPTTNLTTRRLAAVLLAVLPAAALPGVACRQASAPGSAAAPAASQAARYHCPMHPTYVSDRAGDCPICGMRLVPVTGAAAPAGAAQVESVAGRVSVTLSPERRQLLGLRSEPVRVEALERRLRTVGRVAADERRVHHVHTKFEGYVERLYVDFTGKLVRRGEPLLAIYSPELVATQQEYLLALKARRQLAGSGLPQVAEGGRDLLEAARQRLLFWDIRPEDVAELERSGQVQRTLDLHAENTGYVLGKTVFHGMRVMPQDTLFDIVDLSHVWVLADVYEADLSLVREGMQGTAQVPYLPGRSWHGSVSYVAPTVEGQTRTVKVRLEVDNPDGALKPEMYADVELLAEQGRGLVVPESALIPAGERQLVFVDQGDGRLEPREVRVGRRVGDRFEVLSGLKEGEPVVVSANFLLDSESSLRAALAGLGAAPREPAAATPAPAATPTRGPAARLAPSPATAAAYACPMHPGQRSYRSGRCSLCGMDLEPVPAPHRH